MKEADHQKRIIAHVRKHYPNLRFFVNPFAGVTLYNMNKVQAAIFKQKMRELGAEKSQPDMNFNAARCGYTSLTIEQKLPNSYPFKFWRNTNEFWIDKTGDMSKREHIFAQASYMADLKKEGSLAVFSESADQSIELIDQYMNHQEAKIKSRLGTWEFTHGRYIPIKKEIDFLIR